MKRFKIKTEILFGEGALDYLKELKNKKVFIVTDPFMVKSGTIEKLTNNLKESEVCVFSEIVPDPPIELVVSGIEMLKEFNPDIVIALGGGSAIDATKAIIDFSKKLVKLNEIKFIAIPTTSGTGSEVTSFSVITDKQKGVKYPLVSDELLPDIAILDPELVRTVPNFITADTGMDVLTHALEAYVSKNATDFSDALAEKAATLVFKYLLKAYEDGNDIEAREKMHNASCLAGLAFNEASLGVNHGIAHVLGGKFHVPHGRTNSILLPHVIEYNADITGYNSREFSEAAEKYARIAKIVGLQGSNTRGLVKNLINEIKKMQKTMNMPTTLRECKVDIDEVNRLEEEVAKLALKDACTETNPRIPDEKDIILILNKIK
ncbi:iron-containing alcohol dehydrogenase [Clostridium perfringens]|nr:iron-containing alcohol dehydrogenase [Clostridium perfringens]